MLLLESDSLLPTRRDIVARLFRQRGILLLAFALVILGFLLTGQFRPKYMAEMKVLVRKQRVDPVVTTGNNSMPALFQLNVSEEELNSEVEMLKGENLLRQIVVQVGLTRGHATDPVSIAKAVRRLRKDLDVSAIPKTDLISAKYEGHTPKEAQAVLTRLAALYLARSRDTPERDFQVNFFQDQVDQHLKALQAAEARLSDFTRATGMVSGDLERELSVRQLSDALQQQRQTSTAISETRARETNLAVELLGQPERISTETTSRDNPLLLQQLNTTLLNLRLKRQELVAKYDPNYRLVQDVDREIALNEDMIRAQTEAPVRDASSNVNPLRQSLERELEQTRAELTGLQARAQQLAHTNGVLKTTSEQLVGKDLRQNELLRAVRTEGDQYQMYVDKLDQARMTAALDRDGILNVAIVEPPDVPALRANPLPTVLGVMLFASLVLGFSAAFLADVFDPTVRTRAELRNTLEMPALGGFSREIYLEGGQR